MDPEPDLGRAVVELRAGRRGRDRPVEGPGAAAARRGGGRDGVAARALDGGVELVGAVAERRLRGPRGVHGGRRRWIWGPGSGSRPRPPPRWVGGGGGGGRSTRWEGEGQGEEAHGRSVQGWAAMGNRAGNWGRFLSDRMSFCFAGRVGSENAV